MTQGLREMMRFGVFPALVALAGQPALAQSIEPQVPADNWPAPAAQPSPAPTSPAPNQAVAQQPLPVFESVMAWPVKDARDLLAVIEGIGAEGLAPADYRPDALRAAIAKGEGPDLDDVASKSFSWLVEDLRDGRTPMTARVQWFAVDPDQDDMPTAQIMAQALSDHDVAGVVDKLAPTVPDYATLKQALAETPAADKATRALIRANMDRWRWLKRDLGEVYLLTNVPEFQLRLTVKNRIIRSYRTVVGKPGRTATPQLAETVTAVVFNPTWTVPQSIVKGEGLGARVLGSPGWAAANGYKGTRNADGTITVVQQPGPNNALGLMKIDMPNPHAIYLHDTPSKSYFNADVRAFSHGCIRTERAVELGMTMAILGAQMPAEDAADISRSGKYTKVEMTRTFPVYIGYFTMARSIDGELRKFGDIYGRDKPVLASFAAPRQLKTTQRKSDEAIIELDNPF
ncbi:L,D-transpeptidase family protein [Novosphingobium album (ex Liu et al. 2023)]|uniref:L,D-transpeptidase family protein n=1 Tax=Novosphingobium album (ex Liu et al. 2023) TaxID=3031130 RepID=A0ABT5WLI8_9SPHN|nr:L,D-transpeptidase family protein [Novosphingobium album (ex Liu et al. 2023)]MDE8650744.1 L,D-transpeptidase family protein [Novosphingobium album (ex Liu et al. 2023)]